MNRREFLTAAARRTRYCLPQAVSCSDRLLDIPAQQKKVQATDTVVLGKTGIKTSRLAMGTGTVGFGGGSNQTRMGQLVQLLVSGYDSGLIFFDTADSYGSHPEVSAALKQVGRSKAVVMTKCDDRDPKQAKAGY